MCVAMESPIGLSEFPRLLLIVDTCSLKTSHNRAIFAGYTMTCQVNADCDCSRRESTAYPGSRVSRPPRQASTMVSFPDKFPAGPSCTSPPSRKKREQAREWSSSARGTSKLRLGRTEPVNPALRQQEDVAAHPLILYQRQIMEVLMGTRSRCSIRPCVVCL